jgi:glycosyltransferase involved in cell wall biosynthesis
VVEAQYLGIPPIVSKVDGLNLLVKQEKTGLKVPPANSLAIAEAIIKLKEDKALYQKISEESRKQVIDKFDIAKKIDNFIKVYEKAIKNTSS